MNSEQSEKNDSTQCDSNCIWVYHKLIYKPSDSSISNYIWICKKHNLCALKPPFNVKISVPDGYDDLGFPIYNKKND